MKKHFGVFILFNLLIIMCCSCESNVNEAEPDYQLYNSEYSGEDAQIDSDSNNQSAIDTIVDESNSITNTPVLSAEELWPYPLDFKGITTSGTNKTGNLSINRKNDYSLANLICPDVENNIVYYVNYGVDNYVYQLKDDVSSLVLEKEVFYLNLWQNKLYFICKNSNSDGLFISGDIYSYNLETKELQLVKQANAINLIIDSFGIYYEEVVDGISAFYTLDYDGKNQKKIDNPYIQSYYEYKMYVNANGIFLYNSDSLEETYLAPMDYLNNNPKIYDNYFIFTKGGSFYFLNLLNGEKKVFSNNSNYIVDYIVIDNIIYLSFGCKIDLTTGLINQYRIKYEDEKERLDFNYFLYTDGSRIYALMTFPGLGNSQKIVDLTYSDDGYLIIKELGE